MGTAMPPTRTDVRDGGAGADRPHFVTAGCGHADQLLLRVLGLARKTLRSQTVRRVQHVEEIGGLRRGKFISCSLRTAFLLVKP